MSLVEIVLQFRQSSSTPDEAQGSELYQVDVVSAPTRGWGGPMSSFGLDTRQAKTLRQFFHGHVRRGQEAGKLAQKEVDLQPFRFVGDKLFGVLPETVQQQLRQAQALARSQGHNLALVLRFDPTAWGLLELPWELLHDPLHKQFFALRGGGVSRQIVLPVAHKIAEGARPQAVLGIWAEPAGVASLQERRENGPAPGRDSHITWLTGPSSLAQLERALSTNHYDALHIVAHGAEENRHEFAFALENESGEAHWCSASDLAIALNECAHLQFVYLDICRSGQSATAAELAIGNVATTLMAAGVPAAIVMQEDMGQEAAGVMAQAFYQALAGEATLAEALTRSRRVARLQHSDPIHWGIPALYTQVAASTGVSDYVWTDWVIDHVLGQTNLIFYTLPGLILPVLIAHLSFALSLLQITNQEDWLPLTAVLMETSLIPVLVASLSQKGQEALGHLHNLQGWRGWLPALLHKYLSACVAPLVLAWFPLWMIWAGLYGAGIGSQLSQGGRQVVWGLGLIGVALAAHVGTRQSYRQNRLFLSFKFSFYTLNFQQSIPLLGMLFAPPLMGVAMLWLLNSLQQNLGLSTAVFFMLMLVAVFMVTLGMAMRLTQDSKS